jgi:glutamate formiminotransferase
MKLLLASLNLLACRRTGTARASDAVPDLAARRGIAVKRAELVGLAPRAAFESRAPETVGLPGLPEPAYLEPYLS